MEGQPDKQDDDMDSDSGDEALAIPEEDMCGFHAYTLTSFEDASSKSVTHLTIVLAVTDR